MNAIFPSLRQKLLTPIWAHGLISLAFLLMALIRLTIPSAPYFDEVHYLPAARTFIEQLTSTNMEHPPLGKLIMAAGIHLLGDEPLGWRLPSVMFGTLALFAAMRAMYFAGNSGGKQTHWGSSLAGLFIATNFLLFVHARIAMLDIFMVCFVMIALWMCAAAWREQRFSRLRLIIAGIALGAAMASKWNAIPLAILPGLTFFAVRLWSAKGDFLSSHNSAPIRGISMSEAGIWLGLLPLITYALTFYPYGSFEEIAGTDYSGGIGGIFALHNHMLDLQTQVAEPHPYQSNWQQWIGNLRTVWYLYEEVDGAQRGIMLIGNPVTMLAGIPALFWCLWAGIKDRRADCLALALLYIISMALWVIAPKAVQFYFHYFLPAMFLSGALGLWVEQLWRKGEKIIPSLVTLGALACFAYWYPILSAAPLEGSGSFLQWAWFEGWR